MEASNMEDRDLPSFLGGDPEAAPVESPVEPTTEAVTEVVEATAIADAPPPISDVVPEIVQTTVPLAALHEERFKRQEFEAKFADLQRQFEAVMANQEVRVQGSYGPCWAFTRATHGCGQRICCLRQHNQRTCSCLSLTSCSWRSFSLNSSSRAACCAQQGR
jgi:hypothetical protein